jgi:methionine-S-sulfoxide reductase
VPGVILTRVGYAGGTMKNPTYHHLGDHSEAVQIDFDPSCISYEELLDIFWKSHDPTRNSWSRQYRAAIFYHDEEQRIAALETKDNLALETRGEIATALEPYSGFSIAEDYHQKHSLRLFPEIMKEITARYPDVKRLIKSSTVTRVNGYLGGYGSCESLKREIEGFGLSDRASEILNSVVCGRNASITCPVH